MLSKQNPPTLKRAPRNRRGVYVPDWALLVIALLLIVLTRLAVPDKDNRPTEPSPWGAHAQR